MAGLNPPKGWPSTATGGRRSRQPFGGTAASMPSARHLTPGQPAWPGPPPLPRHREANAGRGEPARSTTAYARRSRSLGQAVPYHPSRGPGWTVNWARARGEAEAHRWEKHPPGEGKREIAFAMDPPPRERRCASEFCATGVRHRSLGATAQRSPQAACKRAEGGFELARRAKPNPGQPSKQTTRAAAGGPRPRQLGKHSGHKIAHGLRVSH